MTSNFIPTKGLTETSIALGSTGSAVRDVQERLQSLGYDLGEEIEQGIFGALTSKSVKTFRKEQNLPQGSDVDRVTWATLVDATFTLGDRLLYLRMPYFHGQDVRVLQTALGVLGFSCFDDGIFGAHTEHAVREFQQNAGINSDGIVGDSTFAAINRLRHAWEGKSALRKESLASGFARAAQTLEKSPICLYGTDDLAKRVAGRISNLAMATTASSLVSCVDSMESFLSKEALGILLLSEEAEQSNIGILQNLGAHTSVPLVIYDSDSTLNARVATAIGLATEHRPQIEIKISYPSLEAVSQKTLTTRDEQHIAITLLDALCSALL